MRAIRPYSSGVLLMKSALLAAVLALSASLFSSLAFAGTFYACTAETGNQTAYLRVNDTGAVSFSLGDGVLKELIPNYLAPNEFRLAEDTLAYINIPSGMLSISNPAQGGTIGQFQLNGYEVDFECGKSDN
jgi:hypothetical protein